MEKVNKTQEGMCSILAGVWGDSEVGEIAVAWQDGGKLQQQDGSGNGPWRSLLFG